MCAVNVDWVAKYIGIPYLAGGRSLDGVDCWGLCHIVWRDEFSIETPSYSDVQYHGKESRKTIAQNVERYKAGWREICKNDKPDLADARAADGILIRMIGYPIHIAVVTKPGWMLHIEEGVDSIHEEFCNFGWQNRILGVYRHESRT